MVDWAQLTNKHIAGTYIVVVVWSVVKALRAPARWGPFEVLFITTATTAATAFVAAVLGVVQPTTI